MTYDIEEIIDLYQFFDRYKNNSRSQLKAHIEPSIELNQYKTHEQENKLVAFTNWAYMSDAHQEYYMRTGLMLPSFWNSGANVWHIDTICNGKLLDVHRWTKQHFEDVLKEGDTVSWLRVSDKCRVYGKQTWQFLGDKWEAR